MNKEVEKANIIIVCTAIILLICIAAVVGFKFRKESKNTNENITNSYNIENKID